MLKTVFGNGGRLAFWMAAVLGAFGGRAETFTWGNSSNRDADFTVAGNWNGTAPVLLKDGKGVPEQTNDVFNFGGELPFVQSVHQSAQQKYDIPFYFGTVTGTGQHVLAGVMSGNARGVAVKDASGFEGSLGARGNNGNTDGGTTWLLLSEPGNPTEVKNARATHGVDLNVFQAGTTGRVERVWGDGEWRVGFHAGYAGWAAKSKDGTLEVGDVQAGEAGTVRVYNGNTLAVKGARKDAPGLPGNPAVHLDASAEGAVVMEGGRVAEWRDVREGRSFKAVRDGDKLGPEVKADEATGMPFVDFGAMNNRADQKRLGAGDSATLKFAGGAVTGIKEVFVVFKDVKFDNMSGVTSGEAGNNTLYVQNFLGSAAGAEQWFPRWQKRRSGNGYYVARLLDANTAVTSATGNFHRDPHAKTQHNTSADVRLNGGRVDPETEGDFSREANVLSIGYAGAHAAVADRLACNGAGHLGGIAIGELLVYTETLTAEQRREANAYLAAKWRGGGDWDFGRVTLKEGAKFTVSEGTAAVKELETEGGTLAMRGNLRVARIKGEPAIEFRGEGAKEFAVAEDRGMEGFAGAGAPAADPEIWLDANKNVETFATNCFGEAVEYVSKWEGAFEGKVNKWGMSVTCGTFNLFGTVNAGYYFADHDTGLLLPHGEQNKGCPPTLADAGRGLKMVDFGPQNTDLLKTYGGGGVATNLTDGTAVTATRIYDWKWRKARSASAMNLVRRTATGAMVADTVATRTVFFALKLNGDYYPITFGTRNCAALKRKLLDFGVCSGVFRGAEWRVDGEAADPTAYTFEAGRTYVVAARLTEGVAGMGYLAYWEPGNGTGTWGGMSYGEVLAYGRRLTDREVAETEAYLMERWQGAAHPLAAGGAQKVGQLTFAGAEEPGVDVETELEAAMVDTDAAKFVKKGAGAFAAKRMSAAVKEFRVEDGALKTAQDWLHDAAVHLDASEEGSFAWREGQEGESVERWMDLRGNGRYAQSVVKAMADPVALAAQGVKGYRGNDDGMTNAQWRVSDGTDGLAAGMGYVDFLQDKGKAWFDWATGEPAGGNFGNYNGILQGMNECAGMTFDSAVKDVREIHVVYGYNEDKANPTVLPVGSNELSADEMAPGNWDTIFAGGCTHAHGCAAKLDGAGWTRSRYRAQGKAALGTGWHVLTVAFTNGVKATQLAMDRTNCARGGIRIGELVMFTGATNATGRAEAVHAHLRKKWLVEGEGAVAGNALEKITLGVRGSLELGGDAALAAGSVVEMRAGAETNSVLKFGGTLTVEPGAELRVELEEDARRPREWRLLEAGAVEGAENLRVTATGAEGRFDALRAVWRDGAMVLRAVRGGLKVIIR